MALFYFCRSLTSISYHLWTTWYTVDDYTSKKCPSCQNFVGIINIRSLYCSARMKALHQDVLAGQNIVNASNSQKTNLRRPEFFSPENHLSSPARLHEHMNNLSFRAKVGKTSRQLN
jgi:hypothetical protein